jgi:hypothetical protein
MSKVVRAKQTMAGEYGLKQTGEEFLITDQRAEELEAKDLVEIVSHSDVEVSGPKIGPIRVESYLKAPGDKPAHPFSETNPHDATNEAKNTTPKF